MFFETQQKRLEKLKEFMDYWNKVADKKTNKKIETTVC